MRTKTLLLSVVLVIGTSQVVAQPTIEDLPNLSADELYALLTPEEQEELREVVEGATVQSQGILDEYRQELHDVIEEALDARIRAQTQRVLDQMAAEEAALLEAIETELRRQLFLVNLGPDTFQTGIFAWSGNRALCDARQPGLYALFDEICSARRPEGIPESLPPIIDPIIVWYCNMPPAFVPENVRPICNHAEFTGTLYTNPESSQAYGALETLFRNDAIRRSEEAAARTAASERTQDRRAAMMECGEIYRRADMRDLMWVRSSDDLSELSGQRRELVERVRSCRDRFGTEDRGLFRPFTFPRGQEAEHSTYCSPYIRAYGRYHDDVLALQRNRNHRFGTAVRGSVVTTIQRCRSDFSR